jgi:dienelactone hydrolase
MNPLAPVLLAAAALMVPSAADAAVSPPPPTGPAPVGLERLTLTDHTRTEKLAVPRGGDRKIPLRVWYPAAAPGAAAATVLTGPEQAFLESGNNLAAGALDGIAGTATDDAPAAPGKHPVILLSHGGGTTTAFHAAQATDLASHGYVVVGIDHPGDAIGVDDGTGRILGLDPKHDGTGDRPYPIRVRDVRFVLNNLGAIRHAGTLDLRRIGAFGHSAGGSAIETVMLDDPRIDAGAAFEGSVHGDMTRRDLRRPFAYRSGRGFEDPRYDAMLQRFRSRLRGPHPLAHDHTTEHNGYTDQVWLLPQVGIDIKGQEIGTVDPAVAVKQQRSWLLRFFDRYVKAAR